MGSLAAVDAALFSCHAAFSEGGYDIFSQVLQVLG